MTIAVVTAHRDRDEYAQLFRACVPGGVPLAEGTIPDGEPWCRGRALNAAVAALIADDAWGDCSGVLIADIDCMLHPATMDTLSAVLQDAGGAILGVLEPHRAACEALLGGESVELWSEPVTPDSALMDAEKVYTGCLAMSRSVFGAMLATHERAGIPGFSPEYGTWGGEDTFAAASLLMHAPRAPYVRNLVRHLWHPQNPQKPQPGHAPSDAYLAMRKQLDSDIASLKAAYVG